MSTLSNTSGARIHLFYNRQPNVLQSIVSNFRRRYSGGETVNSELLHHSEIIPQKIYAGLMKESISHWQISGKERKEFE